MNNVPPPGAAGEGGDSLPEFSPRDLRERAREQAKSASAPLRRCVYLYYFARYLVSLYESVFSEMPGQILNEFRNGLDHAMRYFSSGGDLQADDGHRNLQKMEGHLQRAVLDACKYLSYDYSEWAARFEKKHGAGVLALVSNGEFWEELQRGKEEAESSFEKAKLADAGLGEDSAQNDDVVEFYVDAAHRWHEIRALCERNSANIARAYKAHDSIRKWGEALSAWKQVFIGVAIGLVLNFLWRFFVQ